MEGWGVRPRLGSCHPGQSAERNGLSEMRSTTPPFFLKLHLPTQFIYVPLPMIRAKSTGSRFQGEEVS